MDKDRIKGSVEQAKGVVKEVVGKATGDAKLEVEGRNEKAAGKVQNAVGGVKDAMRDALKKVRAPARISRDEQTKFVQRLTILTTGHSGQRRRTIMDMTTLLIIVVVVLLIGRRWLLWTGTLVLKRGRPSIGSPPTSTAKESASERA